MKELVIPSNAKLISGLGVQQLLPITKLVIAEKVSQLLKLYQEHMLQFSPEQLIEKFMNSGDTVLIWDQTKLALIGFAKNFLWPGENEQGQKVYEFGSWVVQPEYFNQGLGHQLAIMAVQTVKQKDPKAQVIAVCASDNPKPIGILQELGAFACPKPSNVKVLLGEGETPVTIINMSNINSKNI